jgi:hypothetical protein
MACPSIAFHAEKYKYIKTNAMPSVFNIYSIH